MPKALRERLNLGKGAKLNVHVDRERIILSKPAEWRSLRGIADGSDLLACHRADKRLETGQEACPTQFAFCGP
jgi:bifunctional DNA-binding transcriptional regulator/antitoxin component of YhaV-PrlF toxin-antitoxin module